MPLTCFFLMSSASNAPLPQPRSSTLELFLMLLEVQVIAIAGAFFHTRIKPITILAKQVWSKLTNMVVWDNAKEGMEGMILAVSAPVILMNLLVVSAAIGIVFNVH